MEPGNAEERIKNTHSRTHFQKAVELDIPVKRKLHRHLDEAIRTEFELFRNVFTERFEGINVQIKIGNCSGMNETVY